MSTANPFPVSQHATADTGNSTTAVLAGGAVFTGTAFDVLEDDTTTVSITASHASAANGLSLQWGPDGTNWDVIATSNLAANEGRGWTMAKRGRYFRIVYTNGATLQTTFRLNVHHSPVGSAPVARTLGSSVDDDIFADVVRSVLSARKPDTTYANIGATAGGNIKIAIEEFDAALPAGTNNIGDVDVLSLPAIPAGTNNIGDVDVLTLPALAAGTNYVGKVRLTDGVTDTSVSSTGALFVGGGIAHDAVDSGNPVKIGARAVAHGANPTEVAAADRTDLLANRAGVLFTIGGHPNIQTIRATYAAAAQTNAAIVTVSAGTKIVVTRVRVAVSNSTTNTPLVRIGFATATTPTAAGVLFSHPGIPGGGYPGDGDGSGILGVGADDEDVRITSDAATAGTIDVVLSYFTIPS